MNLMLDHQQRLNLHGLMGAQRVSLDEMRMFWKMQDRIDLSDEEKIAVGYRTELLNGQERVIWDVTKKLEAKGYEFSDAEITRIRKVVEEWPYFMTSTDRAWVEPLLAQLPPGSENGHPKVP
jgi:hypothetical protein